MLNGHLGRIGHLAINTITNYTLFLDDADPDCTTRIGCRAFPSEDQREVERQQKSEAASSFTFLSLHFPTVFCPILPPCAENSNLALGHSAAAGLVFLS